MDCYFIVMCITVLLKTKLVQSIDGDCKAQCLREDDTKCSEVFSCGISEFKFDFRDNSNRRRYFPKITDYGITLKCDKTIRTHPRLGFLIAWRIKGHDISQENITRFLIEVYGGDNELTDLKKFIDIPEKIPRENDIKFSYLFTTTNDEFKIEEGWFEIRIDMVPRNMDFDMKLLGKYNVPVHFDGDLRECKNGTDKNEIWTTTPPKKNDNGIMVSVGLCLALTLLIVLIITFKIYCKKQNKKKTMSPDSEAIDLITQRDNEKILILCNNGIIGNEEWKESVMKIATKLSDNLNNVVFNWKEQQSDEAFVYWLHSKMTWADTLVIISVPNNCESDDVNFHFFNNAVHNALPVRHTDGLNITVAHQDVAKRHSKCPFLSLDYVERLRIFNQDRAWTILYKYLTGNEVVEENGITKV